VINLQYITLKIIDPMEYPLNKTRAITREETRILLDGIHTGCTESTKAPIVVVVWGASV
jgi:hypothetical protein